jgi:superfamily II DNA or RNA helicase
LQFHTDGAAELERKLFGRVGAKGALLADPMGSGKSHTVLLAIQLQVQKRVVRRQTPALLVVPAKLCQQWYRECEIWTPDLLSEIRWTRGSDIGAYNSRERDLGSVIIVSYDVFTHYATFEETLRTYRFALVIFDECYGFEYPWSTTSSHLRLLREDNPAMRVLGISGTPFGSGLGNAAHFLRCLGCEPHQTVDSIHSEISACMVRRVPQQRWSVSTWILPVELSARQIVAYEQVQLKERSQASMASELLALCQYSMSLDNVDDMELMDVLNSSSKLRELHSWLKTVIPQGAKVIIFHNSKYSKRAVMMLLRCVRRNDSGSGQELSRLVAAELPEVNGDISTNVAQRAVQLFEEGEAPVILCR